VSAGARVVPDAGFARTARAGDAVAARGGGDAGFRAGVGVEAGGDAVVVRALRGVGDGFDTFAAASSVGFAAGVVRLRGAGSRAGALSVAVARGLRRAGARVGVGASPSPAVDAVLRGARVRFGGSVSLMREV
jgi:hypothetical protein